MPPIHEGHLHMKTRQGVKGFRVWKKVYVSLTEESLVICDKVGTLNMKPTRIIPIEAVNKILFSAEKEGGRRFDLVYEREELMAEEASHPKELVSTSSAMSPRMLSPSSPGMGRSRGGSASGDRAASAEASMMVSPEYTKSKVLALRGKSKEDVREWMLCIGEVMLMHKEHLAEALNAEMMDDMRPPARSRSSEHVVSGTGIDGAARLSRGASLLSLGAVGSGSYGFSPAASGPITFSSRFQKEYWELVQSFAKISLETPQARTHLFLLAGDAPLLTFLIYHLEKELGEETLPADDLKIAYEAISSECKEAYVSSAKQSAMLPIITKALSSKRINTHSGALLKLYWLILRIQSGETDRRQENANEISSLITTYLDSSRITLETKHALFEMLISKPVKAFHGKSNLFSQRITHAEMWTPILEMITRSSLEMKVSCLEDIFSLLIHSLENRCRLISLPNWATSIFPLLNRKLRSSEYFEVVATNCMSTLLFQYLVMSQFEKKLVEVLNELQKFSAPSASLPEKEAEIKSPATPSSSLEKDVDSISSTCRRLLENLGARIEAGRDLITPKAMLPWENILKYLWIVKSFLFASPNWDFDAPTSKESPERDWQYFDAKHLSLLKRELDEAESSLLGLHWSGSGEILDFPLAHQTVQTLRSLRFVAGSEPFGGEDLTVHPFYSDTTRDLLPQFWEEAEFFLDTLVLLQLLYSREQTITKVQVSRILYKFAHSTNHAKRVMLLSKITGIAPRSRRMAKSLEKLDEILWNELAGRRVGIENRTIKGVVECMKTELVHSNSKLLKTYENSASGKAVLDFFLEKGIARDRYCAELLAIMMTGCQLIVPVSKKPGFKDSTSDLYTIDDFRLDPESYTRSMTIVGTAAPRMPLDKVFEFKEDEDETKAA